MTCCTKCVTWSGCRGRRSAGRSRRRRHSRYVLASPLDLILRYVRQAVRILGQQVVGIEVSPAGLFVVVEVDSDASWRDHTVLLTRRHRAILDTEPQTVD